MGAALSGRTAGRRGRRAFRQMAEINVTPFVDVMLVLLIIFMVTAPLLTVAVPLDLPKTKGQMLSQSTEPLVISVKPDGTVYLQDTSTSLDLLVPKLLAITEQNKETRIFIRGDRKLAYGRMVEVMGAVSAAGFTRLALVADLPLGQ